MENKRKEIVSIIKEMDRDNLEWISSQLQLP